MNFYIFAIFSFLLKFSLASQSEYIYFTIFTKHDQTFKIQSASVGYGNYCEYHDRDKHIDISEVNKITFDKKKEALFGATGTRGLASGVDGSFSITTQDNILVAFVVFNCPWSGSNFFLLIQNPQTADDYACQLFTPVRPQSAIGDVIIRCVKVLE